MIIDAFGVILSSTYTDSMDVYRHDSDGATNEDGTQGIVIGVAPVYSAIKCRISFENADNSESSAEDSNPINLQIKVFCEPTIDIRKGDKLVVTRVDSNGIAMKSYDGIANLPLTYVTHKEVEITQVGDA